MELQTIFNILKDFFKDYIREYIKVTLVKLEDKAIDKVSGLAAALFGLIFLLLTFSLFFIFSTIALALFIGSLLGNHYWGFLIISLFYLAAGILLWTFRKKLIKRPVARILANALKKGDSL